MRISLLTAIILILVSCGEQDQEWKVETGFNNFVSQRATSDIARELACGEQVGSENLYHIDGNRVLYLDRVENKVLLNYQGVRRECGNITSFPDGDYVTIQIASICDEVPSSLELTKICSYVEGQEGDYAFLPDADGSKKGLAQ